MRPPPAVPEVSTITLWKPTCSSKACAPDSGINTRIHTGQFVSLKIARVNTGDPEQTQRTSNTKLTNDSMKVY